MFSCTWSLTGETVVVGVEVREMMLLGTSIYMGATIPSISACPHLAP
jgi:hypothetical protein